MEIWRSHVLVCAGAGCVSSGCREVRDNLIQGVMEFGLQGEVKVIETGCIGSCDLGPIVVVYPEGVFYQKVKAEDVRVIAEEHLFKGRVVERLLYTEPTTTQIIPTFKEIDFFKLQEKIILRNCGLIDPMNIEEYIAREGYEGLAQVLTRMPPQEVVEVVQRSGLRGRGGAGFPAGTKWRFTQQAQGSPKYVVCNADKGDPGPRPPFPAVAGLWKKPTLLNNVETYASIPPIILKGAEWYS